MSYSSSIFDGFVLWLGILGELSQNLVPSVALIFHDDRVRWLERSGIEPNMINRVQMFNDEETMYSFFFGSFHFQASGVHSTQVLSSGHLSV